MSASPRVVAGGDDVPPEATDDATDDASAAADIVRAVADAAAIPLLLAAGGDPAAGWTRWLAMRDTVDRAVASRLHGGLADQGTSLLAAVGSSLATGVGDIEALVQRAESEAQDPNDHADAHRAVAKLGTWSGDTLQTAALTSRAADEIAQVDATREAHLRLDAATTLLNAGHLDLAEAAARRASTACRPCPDLTSTADALLECVRLMRGHAATIETPDAAALAALGPRDVRLGVLVGRALVWSGRHDDARTLLARTEATARATAPEALAFVHEVVGDLDHRAGWWRSGLAAVEEGEERCRNAANRNVRALLLVRRARFDAARGDGDACMERLAIVDGIEQGAALANVRLHAASVRALLAIGDGDHERALAHARRARQIGEEMSLGHPGVDPFHGDLIEACARTGQPHAATQFVDELERAATLLSHAPSMAVASRGRLLLAADADVEAAATVALGHHDEVPMPFERARTLLVLGERRRRLGQRRDARVAVAEAHAEFERLGARPWARRALAELRAAGGRPAAAGSVLPDVDTLSPQEREVVRVVIDGATNREAAAALFLSPKSIERHLTAVYRKLGLRSRSELVRWFALGADRPTR